MPRGQWHASIGCGVQDDEITERIAGLAVRVTKWQNQCVYVMMVKTIVTVFFDDPLYLKNCKEHNQVDTYYNS